jgi:hypothetical protein
MYEINTKRNGHLRVRNAAISHANAVGNPELLLAKLWVENIKQEADKENNFIGKLVKKVNNAMKKKAMDKAQKEIAKSVGPEKAAEMRQQLETHVANSPALQKKMNTIDTIGTLAVATAIAGGAAALAAPAIGGAGAAGGAGVSAGAGGTVSAAEAVGAGATALGAGSSLIKDKSSTDLTKDVTMPDKNSIGPILGPIAGQGLSASGKVSSGKTNEQKIKQFLKEVVGPATGKDLGDLAGSAAEAAMIDFISTIRNKKLNGEKLPKGLDAIAGLTLKAEDKAEQKIKQAAAGNIGEFVMNNWWAILIVIALLYLAARSKKR